MSDDIYQGLREKLENLQFPLLYMFKFVVPGEKLAEIKSLFPKHEITEASSKTGKYVSITFQSMEASPNDIIDVYRRAATVEGVVSL